MSYFKIFAISVCFSLLFLSVFVMVAFDSENTLNKAYDYFADKQYYEARYLLINEDNPIPLADFYLYEAYLAREELGLKKSQGYLRQAIQELSNKKSSTAQEIHLNLALNSFLLNDEEALKKALEQSRKLSIADEPWISFFTGCQAYLEQDYDKALTSWNNSKSRKWLSNWMKTGFEHHLSNERIGLLYLHSELENGHLFSTRQNLEQYLLTLPEQFHQDIQVLLALNYIKECDMLPYGKRNSNFLKSIELLKQVPSTNYFYIKKRNEIFSAYKTEILDAVSNHHFSDIPAYIVALEGWKASEQLDELTTDLVHLLNEKIMTNHHADATALLQNLSLSIAGSELKQLFTMKLSKQMYEAITQGKQQHLITYASIFQNYLSDSALSVLADTTASKILELVENDDPDFGSISPYISRWQTLEKNSQNRYLLAQQLIQKAQRLWSINGESQKAFNLLKIAKFLPASTEENLILADIEQAILKTYHQALLQDHIHEFPHILMAMQSFHLSADEILDPKEIANQLADAQYLFEIGRYSIASTKASWVLQLDSNNQIARKIAALTAYEEGRYSEANEHFKNIQMRDSSINHLFLVSALLANDHLNNSYLLEELTKTPLSNETALRLAFGYLTLSQPEQSLFWLNKIPVINDEILLGLCIASFQKQDWPSVIESYNKLSSPYTQIQVVQGFVIQALVAQNKKEQAQAIFDKFTLFQNPHLDFQSKPFSILQNHLNSFDAHDFAARYYLYVQKDTHNALKQFREIKNTTPELLVERAELAFSLNYFSESIEDLQKSLEGSKGNTREKALILLGNIYLQLAFYPDSVHHFKELFSLNPQQIPSVHQSYCNALIAIGRLDLALPHFVHLGKSAPDPLIAPQELGMVFDSNMLPQKKLNLLKLEQAKHPNSISLQIQFVKELIRNTNESRHDSDAVLLAFALLETVIKNYPYIPEVWFLQGQILAQLHQKQSAHHSFIHAITLNPSYAEAYKHLAALNISENDVLAATYNLKQAVKMIPYDVEAWNSLAALEPNILTFTYGWNELPH